MSIITQCWNIEIILIIEYFRILKFPDRATSQEENNNKRHPDWKGRSKSVFNWRQYDQLYKKLDKVYTSGEQLQFKYHQKLQNTQE